VIRVAVCVSEAVPFAKTGGLADVAGALPHSLRKMDVEPVVIMPAYGFIFKKDFNLKKIADNITVDMNRTYSEQFDLFSANNNGVNFYFIKNDKFFERENLYGTPKGDYSDNNVRFGFFSKAIFAVLEKLSFKTDIIHLHDYHFALTAVILRDLKSGSKNTFFKNTGAVFTIHNLAYQGIYDSSTLDICGISRKHLNIDGLEFYGKVNFMKAGIVYSDKITTVSPTYSREILTRHFGYGLEGVLTGRKKDLIGIINGIDYNLWNPATDSSISSNYDIKNLDGKRLCKQNLLSIFFGKSADINKPLLGMVSRLSEQKGIDLVADAMDAIMKNDLYLVILGTGDEKYHNIMLKLQSKYKEKFSLTIGYSDKLSREIYSGADIFLMPSNFEPCGLGQLISLKYGTIPVVRNTGGLADTIIDINTIKDIKKGGQGFKFSEYSRQQFYSVLKRAVDFYNDRNLWTEVILNGMRCNFSWDYSAEKYKNLYNSII